MAIFGSNEELISLLNIYNDKEYVKNIDKGTNICFLVLLLNK